MNDDHTIRGPGMLIRDARIARGLSRRDIAKSLLLSLPQIEALEHNRFAELPAAVFLRGYLRAIAKLLDIDVAELLKRYEMAAKPEERGWQVTTTNQPPRPPSFSLMHTISFIGLTVIVLATLWLLWWWWQPQVLKEGIVPEQPAVLEDGDSTVLPEEPIFDRVPAEENAITLTEDASLTALATEQPLAIDNPSSTENPLLEADPALGEPAATAPEIITTPLEGDEQLDSMVIKSRQESWLEVYDKARQTLFYGRIEQGKTLHFQAAAPFRIVLGRANSIRLLHNDETVDITPFVRSNGSAYFILDKDGPKKP